MNELEYQQITGTKSRENGSPKIVNQGDDMQTQF